MDEKKENAVETSLSSEAWRCRWPTTPNLVFDDNCFITGSQREFIEFVTFCLLLHQGPIDKFSLRTSFLRNTLVIDQWLLFLSRNDVKELNIELAEDWFRAHSCIFSCSNLTHLELYRCELYLPPSFQGFLFLKVLSLQLFSMPPDDVQTLISSCPVLVNLTLRPCMEMELTLSAPCLKYLTLEGDYRDIYLQNTPLLAVVNVSEHMTEGAAKTFGNGHCNFDRFFGGTSRLEKLVGLVNFTKYLSRGLESSSMSKQCDHLKSIELHKVCFEDMDDVAVLLRLIVASPNLQNLHVFHVRRSSTRMGTHQPSTDVNFWEREQQCPKKSMFNELKTVKCSNMGGGINEMKFIKFILESSPVLETLSIVANNYKVNKSNETDMLLALINYPRASTQAKLVFGRKEL